MSRLVAILALVTACHGAEDFYAKPNAEKFAKMTDDERCEATFPRAEPCLDELVVAMASAIGSPESADELTKSFREAPSGTEKERREMHHIQCLDPYGGSTYAKSVLACWDQHGCKAFAACVYPPEPKQP